MADYRETQETQRRIRDWKTGRDYATPVAGQSLNVTETEQRLDSETTDIVEYGGKIVVGTEPKLAFCRFCGKGPFVLEEAVIRCCRCADYTCKRRCGREHQGQWFCRRCNWRRVLKDLFFG